jgi:hypothetical protein
MNKVQHLWRKTHDLLCSFDFVILYTNVHVWNINFLLSTYIRKTNRASELIKATDTSSHVEDTCVDCGKWRVHPSIGAVAILCQPTVTIWEFGPSVATSTYLPKKAQNVEFYLQNSATNFGNQFQVFHKQWPTLYKTNKTCDHWLVTMDLHKHFLDTHMYRTLWGFQEWEKKGPCPNSFSKLHQGGEISTGTIKIKNWKRIGAYWIRLKLELHVVNGKLDVKNKIVLKSN